MLNERTSEFEAVKTIQKLHKLSSSGDRDKAAQKNVDISLSMIEDEPSPVTITTNMLWFEPVKSQPST